MPGKNTKCRFVRYCKTCGTMQKYCQLKEVSFEYSHYRILMTESKVRTTPHVSIIINSERERVKCI